MKLYLLLFILLSMASCELLESKPETTNYKDLVGSWKKLYIAKNYYTDTSGTVIEYDIKYMIKDEILTFNLDKHLSNSNSSERESWHADHDSIYYFLDGEQVFSKQYDLTDNSIFLSCDFPQIQDGEETNLTIHYTEKYIR